MTKPAKLKRYEIVWLGQRIWTCDAANEVEAQAMAEKATGGLAEEFELREITK